MAVMGELRITVTEQKIARTVGDARRWRADIERAVPGEWEPVQEVQAVEFEWHPDLEVGGIYSAPRELPAEPPSHLVYEWEKAQQLRDEGVSQAFRVETLEEFRRVMNAIGFKDHEPDEVDISAAVIEVRGSRLDNAGFWPQNPDRPHHDMITEFHIIVSKEDKPVAVVNVSTLMGWALHNE